MKILIVEDNNQLSDCLSQRFCEAGYEVDAAATLSEVRELIHRQWPDFVLLDANFPSAPGQLPDFNAPTLLELLGDYERPFPPVILMSGDDKTADYFDTLLKWLGTGRIADILPKATKGGWNFLKELLFHRVEIHRSIRSGGESDDQENSKAWLLQQGIISEEPEMFRIAQRIKRIVSLTHNDTSILITGPSGSGKGMLASAIHAEMQRLSKKQLQYIHVACGGLLDSAAKVELLGATKGSYTGAVSDRAGFLAEAVDGVLLLDDIHGLPREALGALLGALQERKYMHVGSKNIQYFRARAICTTNVALDILEKQGLMPDEFYYRIARSTIVVPSLAQRRRDIEPLMNHFLSAFCSANGRDSPVFHQDVVTAFQNYDWPGDVRQLRNVVEDIAVFIPNKVVTLEAVRSLDIAYKAGKIEWAPFPVPEKDSDLLLLRFDWPEGWAKLDSDDFVRVGIWLKDVFRDGSELIKKWTECISGETDPKAIHFLKVLLFIGLVESRKADHKELEDVLGLRWEYTDRVISYLASPKTLGTEVLPPLLMRSKSGRKWIYTLSPELKLELV